MHSKKRTRQSELQKLLDKNPFMSDEKLAKYFEVSIQTIRLDRMELGIPELRERVKLVAHDAYAKIKSLGEQELVGQLRELELGSHGKSVLDTTMEMIFEKTKVVRGHHIFAQANSLSVALVDAAVALTADASIQFVRPVYAGERLECTATVVMKTDTRVTVEAVTKSSDTTVFTGKFSIAVITEQEG
ncbi:MAG: transcription factor FapR [Firmicutes bacterium]|nr:transcription factor FapR [Bacillota bacterium]